MNTISELSVDTSRGEMMDINVCIKCYIAAAEHRALCYI